MNKSLIVAYGSDNITINHPDGSIVLTNQEAKHLLRSLIRNLDYKIEIL